MMICDNPCLFIISKAFDRRFKNLRLNNAETFLHLILILKDHSQIIMQTHFFTEICLSQTLSQPFLLNLCQRLQLSYTPCRNLISDCLCNPVHSYQICHPFIPRYDSIRIRLIKSGAERLVGSCSP